MAQYTAQVIWSRGDASFLDNKYSRKHLLKFDGGVEVAGSSSPHVVPLPYSEARAIDPEEAFVSSLSSCHMLWFLSIAIKHKYVVDQYEDTAVGIMAKNAQGKLAMTQVTLRPKVLFAGKQPSTDELNHMHHQAHEECFIANSVLTKVVCEPAI